MVVINQRPKHQIFGKPAESKLLKRPSIAKYSIKLPYRRDIAALLTNVTTGASTVVRVEKDGSREDKMKD